MNRKERKEIAEMNRQKRMNEAGVDESKIHFPEYWKKHKGNIAPELMKELQETAERDHVVADEYGVYKPGTFLYRAFIVTVLYENELWSVHIFGENAVTQSIIQEVRDRFVPDYCVMLQFYPSREERKATKGVILYEMPGSTEADESTASEAE